MPDPLVIDPGALKRLSEWGGEELPRKMIEIFLSHAPVRVEQIREGVMGNDPRRAVEGAHSLKSSAGNLGATRVQTLCQAVEAMAEEGDLPAAQELLPELDRAYARAREELERILQGMVG